MYRTALTGEHKDAGSEVSSEVSQPVPTSSSTAIFPAFSENSSLQITTTKLNNQNFLQWSRFALIVIRGWGRLCYEDGSMKKPNPGNLSFPTWDAQNSMVMMWIVNSMKEDIKDSYWYYSTAKDMWDALTLPNFLNFKIKLVTCNKER